VGEDRVRKIIFIFLLFLTTLYADRNGGPYVGIGYTYTTYTEQEKYYDVQENSDESFKIELGAFINKYLSVALEYDAKNRFKKQDSSTISFSMIHINTQAHYQFYNDKIDIFGKFGAGEVDSDADTGFGLVYGAGISYRINQRYEIVLGYDYVDVGVDINNDDSSDFKIDLGVSYISFRVQF
jgi:opacity protein-like surface antigen